MHFLFEPREPAWDGMDAGAGEGEVLRTMRQESARSLMTVTDLLAGAGHRMVAAHLQRIESGEIRRLRQDTTRRQSAEASGETADAPPNIPVRARQGVYAVCRAGGEIRPSGGRKKRFARRVSGRARSPLTFAGCLAPRRTARGQPNPRSER